jgi:hypothetical protein
MHGGPGSGAIIPRGAGSRFRWILPGCLFLLWCNQAFSQVPFDACRDRRDSVILGVVDNTIAYAGVATEQNGRPVILWNNKANQVLSTTEQIFIYLHECAHHTLGHLHRHPYTPELEQEADCWAVQLMVDGGMIKARHLEVLERSSGQTRGDAFHLGGEALVQSLRRCLEIRTDPKAWASALDSLVRASQDSFASSRGRAIDSAPGNTVHESTIDAPGTYDCEIIGAAARCLVFASRKNGPAEDRFEQLARIIHGWLPVGWTSIKRVSLDRRERTFLAQDGMSGTLVSLALTRNSRVYLLVKRASV